MYHQVIAEWLAAGKQVDQPLNDITINEIIARFWKHAEGYYVRPDGSQTYEINNFRQALRPLQFLYGTTPAVEFGPRSLVAVRHNMVQKGLCRNNINKMVIFVQIDHKRSGSPLGHQFIFFREGPQGHQDRPCGGQPNRCR